MFYKYCFEYQITGLEKKSTYDNYLNLTFPKRSLKSFPNSNQNLLIRIRVLKYRMKLESNAV